MLQLSDDQKQFLMRYNIPLSAIFDATGLSKKEYRKLMKQLDKYIAIGVTPCKAKNHTLRMRAGHCVQCHPETLTYFHRYYNNSTVYVAASIESKRIKVGYTKNIKERENALNNTSYAGNTDWKIIYYANCKYAGKVESEIQKKLSEYYSPSEYTLGDRRISCYEIFSCGYHKVKEVVNELKSKYFDEFGSEVELNNIEKDYNFENNKNISVSRKGNLVDKIDKVTSQSSSEDGTFAARRSEFIEELNNINNPERLDSKHTYTQQEKGLAKIIYDDNTKQPEEILEKDEYRHADRDEKQLNSIRENTYSIEIDHKNEPEINKFDFFKIIFLIIIVLILTLYILNEYI